MARIDLIQTRGDTAANWIAANPVLGDREMSLETDTLKTKFGDGVTPWNSLPYATTPPSTTSTTYDLSDLLVAGDKGAAAFNALVIQSALDRGSSRFVRILSPGTFYTNQISLGDNTILEIGQGVTLSKPDNYPVTMIINKGALAGTPTRNSNIAIIGVGTIDGNATGQVATLTQASASMPAVNTFLYGVQGEVAMLQVDGCVFSVRKVTNVLGFGFQFIGTNLEHRRTRYTAIGVDCIHINGPSKHGIIDDVTGQSNDQFIAFNAWDWHRSGPTVGDIRDFTATNVAYYGSTGNRTNGLAAFLPGTRATGYGTGTGNVDNIRIKGFVWDPTQGSVTPASAAIQPTMIKDQIDGAEYSGAGTISNISIEDGLCVIPNSNCYGVQLCFNSITADGQADVTLKNFRVKGVHFKCSGTSMTANQMVGRWNYWRLQGVKFEDCEWTPRDGTASDLQFIYQGIKTTPNMCEVNGLTINSNTSTGKVSAFYSGSYDGGTTFTAIDDLTLDRIKTAHGYSLPGAWLNVTGPITRLRSRGNEIKGPGAGSDNQGICFGGANATITDGVISDAHFDGVKEMVMVTTSAAGAGTLTFRDCRINNCTHPVYHNNASTLDVSFKGGSLNAGSNLARTNNASAALTISFEGTTSSGAGATTITVVSGTCRLRQMDRIQFATNVVLTPSNGDTVFFSGTPAYTGVSVISGTLAGTYIYRGTGTAGWVKLN